MGSCLLPWVFRLDGADARPNTAPRRRTLQRHDVMCSDSMAWRARTLTRTRAAVHHADARGLTRPPHAVVISCTSMYAHPKYKKYVTTRSKYMAHDEHEEFKVCPTLYSRTPLYYRGASLI